MVKVEVLCGSVRDCISAQNAKADRIELNSGTLLGGLTPSLGLLREARKRIDLPIVVMIRPRSGGFYYDDTEYATMLCDARIMLENGADGIVFGFLTADRKIDIERTQAFVDLAKTYGKEPVFHRAFDNVIDADEALTDLIACGVKRVLTSGLRETALEGATVLHDLNSRYGDMIEILAGSGVTHQNLEEIVRLTGIQQVHGSFKRWTLDVTSGHAYQTCTEVQEEQYFEVDESILKSAIECAMKL